MTVTTTSSLDNSVRAQYHGKYIEGAKHRRLYDAFAEEMPKEAGEDFLGTSYNVSFLNAIAPSETAISQTADVTPVVMSDNTASVTPTSFGNAVQFSELMKISAFTNFNEKIGGYYNQVGESMMDSLEVLAKKQAVCGTWVRRYPAIVRNTLDAGTAAHTLTYDSLIKDASQLKAQKAPFFVDGNGNMPMAIAHSNCSYDLLASGQPLLGIATYQDKNFLLDGEIGMLGGVRLTFSPFAHVFWGAGVANSTATVVTTSVAAVAAGDKTIELTTVGSLAAGMHLSVGSIETASTLYPITESVFVVSVSSSTATIIGSGPNGGFMYDHDILAVISNADNVYPVVYGGQHSLVKIYAGNVHGPFGKIIDPDVTGLLDQFISIGYKFYGNYGILANNRLLRREVSASLDA
jgi:N4-gp56 family major capsid protein